MSVPTLGVQLWPPIGRRVYPAPTLPSPDTVSSTNPERRPLRISRVRPTKRKGERT